MKNTGIICEYNPLHLGHRKQLDLIRQDDPNDGGGYAPGASFIGYLISRFGEEKVIDILLKSHDFGEYTYEEMVSDWNTYINETYGEYTRSK